MSRLAKIYPNSSSENILNKPKYFQMDLVLSVYLGLKNIWIIRFSKFIIMILCMIWIYTFNYPLEII